MLHLVSLPHCGYVIGGSAYLLDRESEWCYSVTSSASRDSITIMITEVTRPQIPLQSVVLYIGLRFEPKSILSNINTVIFKIGHIW